MEEHYLEKDGNGFPGVATASTISLALDDYEDIFSDFDPSPYSERMLSADFLNELKRAAVDREEQGLLLTLELPRGGRNPEAERIILERLKGHFRRHCRRLEAKRKGQRKLGAGMVALGVAFMFLATYILFAFKQTLLTSFVVVLLEPAGWFTFWEGLNLILFQVKNLAPDLGFYRKMSAAKLAFASLLPPANKPPERKG